MGTVGLVSRPGCVPWGSPRAQPLWQSEENWSDHVGSRLWPRNFPVPFTVPLWPPTKHESLAKFSPLGLPQDGQGNHKTQLEVMRGTEVTPRGPVAAPGVGIPDRPGAGPALSLTLLPAWRSESGPSPRETRAGDPQLVLGETLGSLLSAWQSLEVRASGSRCSKCGPTATASPRRWLDVKSLGPRPRPPGHTAFLQDSPGQQAPVKVWEALEHKTIYKL